MLKTLLASYGVKEWEFLRSASSPKLESLAVPSFLPVEEEPIKKEDEKATTPSSVRRWQLLTFNFFLVGYAHETPTGGWGSWTLSLGIAKDRMCGRK